MDAKPGAGGHQALMLALGACLVSLAAANPGLAIVLNQPNLAGSNTPMDVVCVEDNNGALTDDTTDATTATGNDVELGLSTGLLGSKRVYFGMNWVFAKLVVRIGTAGTDGSVTWTYSKGGGQWAPLVVDDETESFTNIAKREVRFAPPDDWARNDLNGPHDCTNPFYYVRAETLANDPYTVLPLASQIGSLEYNVRVRVEDEAGGPVRNLGPTNFHLEHGDDPTVHASREVSPGVYELALNTTGDNFYDLRSSATGLVNASAIQNVEVTTTLNNLTSTPLVHEFPLRVQVHAVDGSTLSGATVRLNQQSPSVVKDYAYYFAGTSRGRLSVQKPGYQSLDVGVDKALADLDVRPTAATSVVLVGSTPCIAPATVAPGSEVTCRGLAPSTPTSSGPTGSGSSSGSSRSSGASSGAANATDSQGRGGVWEGRFQPLRGPEGSAASQGLWWAGALVAAAILIGLAVLFTRRGRRPPEEDFEVGPYNPPGPG